MEKLQKIGKFFKNWKIGKFEKLAKKIYVEYTEGKGIQSTSVNL